MRALGCGRGDCEAERRENLDMRRATLFVTFLLAVVACGGNNSVVAFSVTFKNDLGRPVLLTWCGVDTRHPHCAKPGDASVYRLKPGGSYASGFAPGVPQVWAVEAPSGQKLRCVNLYWKVYPGFPPEFALSASGAWAIPCRPPSSPVR